MQIAAYKDPVSGRIFEDQDALDVFLKEQKDAAEKAARIETIRARLLELRTVVARTLTAPAELAGLVHRTYAEVLALLDELADLRGVRRTKASRKTKLEVRQVTASRVNLTPGQYSVYQTRHEVYLQVNLAVLFSTAPNPRVFCDEMPNLDFRTVITGMESSGGGGCNDDPATGEYHMDYSMRIPLSQLPLMHPRVAELIELEKAKHQHDGVVESARWEARESDAELKRAEAALEEAKAAFQAARARCVALQTEVEEREAAVDEAVSTSRPFAEQAKLDSAQAGFEDLSDKVDWQSLSYAM